MNYLSVILITLMCVSNVFAESDNMDCVNGRCEGWEGSYERRGDAARFLFLNKTDKPAFKIKVLINCYDYFDTFISRIEQKTDGPINVQLPFISKIPPKTSKMTYDIYYVDEYQP